MDIDLIYADDEAKLYSGNAFDCLLEIPENTIQTVITSPTYWGKRSFTDDSREFGSEPLEVYIDKNVKLYTEILNKMKQEGSLFIIIQDSYMGSGISRTHHNYWKTNIDPSWRRDGLDSTKQGNISSVTAKHDVIKNKSLCGIPFRIAIKLVDEGFIWRETIIWEKPNPMPENVKDRLRHNCEYILHFTKHGKYKFNKETMMIAGKNGKKRMDDQVWRYSSEPKKGHTATFPSKIVKRLLLATTDKNDTVFEPFLGSGTMYDLCHKYGRKFVGCDINKDFVEQIAKRASLNKKREITSYI